MTMLDNYLLLFWYKCNSICLAMDMLPLYRKMLV